MSDWLTKFLESINIFPAIQKHFWTILLFISILGWFFFILPVGVFQTLQIEGLRSNNLQLIGVATFVSTFGLFFGLAYKGYQYLKRRIEAQWKRDEHYKLLEQLTPMENEYLMRFIDSNSPTATFSLYDGVIIGLVDKGILYQPNSKSNMSGEQDFNLYPWAYEYIKKRRHLEKHWWRIDLARFFWLAFCFNFQQGCVLGRAALFNSD